MIENICNFSELFWHLPFFQVVLRWWNKSKRRCRKLCVCHIGANVKTSFDRWMRLRHCCLPACHYHSIERTHCVVFFSFVCMNVSNGFGSMWNNTNWFIGLKLPLEYMIWISPLWNVMRCLSMLEIAHKTMLEHENCQRM